MLLHSTNLPYNLPSEKRFTAFTVRTRLPQSIKPQKPKNTHLDVPPGVVAVVVVVAVAVAVLVIDRRSRGGAGAGRTGRLIA